MSAANAIDVGTNIAADNPSTARDKSNNHKCCAKAKKNSAIANISNPHTNIGFRPTLSEIRPTMGEAINCTNANREDITPMSKAVKWYSFLMNGSTGKIRLIPRQIKNSQKRTTKIIRFTSFVMIYFLSIFLQNKSGATKFI